MYCSKCGKEISDDSVFCYFCGSKVEIKEKSDTVKDIPPSIINTETTPELQNTTQETNDEQILKKYLEKSNSNKLKTNKEIGYGYGWLILFSFYSYGMRTYIKDNPSLSVTGTQMLIEWIGLVGVLTFYFWFRFFLIRRNFWKGHISSSSCLSGIVSYILITFLISFSLSYMGSYEKGKDVKSFLNNYKIESEFLKKQGLEYSKMWMSEPKTELEVKDKILKLDEYKNFLIKKDEKFKSFINFFREINSKYKKDKSVDEQINKLEIMNRDGLKISYDMTDSYKNYLITDDKKYYDQYQQEYERQQSLDNEVIQLIINIGKSLDKN